MGLHEYDQRLLCAPVLELPDLPGPPHIWPSHGDRIRQEFQLE